MPANQFSPEENLPNELDLKNLVSNFEYRKLEIHQLPSPIIKNGLVTKCNSFILAASGSTNGMLYSLVGIRPDKGDVFDENPFVYYYDYNDPSKNFGGIIHHGNWPDRTVAMEPWQIAAIANSGMTASFTYKSIPPNGSGTLDDLRANGMIDGLSDQFQILFKNQIRDKGNETA